MYVYFFYIWVLDYKSGKTVYSKTKFSSVSYQVKKMKTEVGFEVFLVIIIPPVHTVHGSQNQQASFRVSRNVFKRLSEAVMDSVYLYFLCFGVFRFVCYR